MKSIIIAFTILITQASFAQVDNTSDLFIELEKLDRLIFEQGFNKCQFSDFEAHISTDLEFYHDKGGVSKSKETFITTLKQNICSNWDRKPIRKLTAGSLEVHALYNNGVLYGAIQSGEHQFYIAEPGKEMYLTSTAKFTHLWVKDNSIWQLKRVLSYDHQIPVSKNNKNAIVVSDQILQLYAGQYEAPNTGIVTIKQEGAGLKMSAGEMQLSISPESERVFFAEGKDLTFEFVKTKAGQVEKMIVREGGQIVEEAKRVPSQSRK